MTRLFKWAGQAVIYGGIALWLGYFANMPVYTHLDPELALIKLSVIHSAQRKGECRKRTQEELEALNPNMRKPYDCPRERLPIHLELLLNGELIYDEILQPACPVMNKSYSLSCGLGYPISPPRVRMVPKAL